MTEVMREKRGGGDEEEAAEVMEDRGVGGKLDV